MDKEGKYSPLPFRESVGTKISTPVIVHKEEESGPPEIPADEIFFDEEKDFLGEGAFGRVYAGRCRGKAVAVKVPLKQDLTEDELKAFRHEVQIMRKIFHPNVVLFLGACTTDKKVMIITELMETDLEKLLHLGPTLTLLEKMKLAKDAALGMNWLHGINSIIHRDLKPANLLIDKNRCVKVTDFGFSQLKPGDKQLKDTFGPKGTALYMAPEVMNQKPFNEKADIYSFGLILFEILTGEELFPEYDEWDEFEEAICIHNVRPKVPKETIPSLSYLIEKCWHPKPEERPSFKEVVFRLDEIIVDCYLQHGEGRKWIDEAREFWKSHFLIPKQTLSEAVLWREFTKVLGEDLKMSSTDFENFKILLATKPEGSLHEEFVVTLERFSQILQWFGPFFLPQEAPTILSQINELLSKTWFHGDISKDLAEKRLFKREGGTFLLRLSLTRPNYPFTISKLGAEGVFQHKRIRHMPDTHMFSVPVRGGGNREFKNILELVSCSELGLKTPCPKNEVQYNPYKDEEEDTS